MDNRDITCSICLHDRKQPKILTCLHVYCCQCLSDYVNKSLQDGQFPCPLCRQQIQISSGGVEDFPDFSDGGVKDFPEFSKGGVGNVSDVQNGSDDVVNTKAETDDVSEMTDVPPARTESLCDVCENKTIAKFRCKDCKQSFCDSCKKNHDKFQFTKSHVVVDVTTESDEAELSDDGNQDNQVSDTIVSSLDMCPVHPSKPIKIYCVECKRSVCLQCYVDETNRGVHNGHNILNLDDHITQTKLRNDLKCLNPKLQIQIDRLQIFSLDLKLKLIMIDMSSVEACNKVDQQVQVISKWIQSRAKQIKTQITQSRNIGRNKLENLDKEMEIFISKLESDIENSQMTLEGESVVKIVERSEINRNDEMEVKDKDLFLPDLEFPKFFGRNDVPDEIESLFGECRNSKLQTFTLKFNLPKICNNKYRPKQYFNFTEYKWFVEAGSNKKYVCLYLHLAKSKKCKKTKKEVEYSFTFLNKVAGDSLTKGPTTYTLGTGAHGHGYKEAISLAALKNPNTGFVNEDGNFTIRLSIHEVEW